MFFYSRLASKCKGTFGIDFWHVLQGYAAGMDAWDRRTPELIHLLAELAPQLRSLEHNYPCKDWDPSPAKSALALAAALPPELARLSQLTSLRLGFRFAQVTTAQVDAILPKLPLLQYLCIRAGTSYALTAGFPVKVFECSQLRQLEIYVCQLGVVPKELERLRALTRLKFHGWGSRAFRTAPRSCQPCSSWI